MNTIDNVVTKMVLPHTHDFDVNSGTKGHSTELYVWNQKPTDIKRILSMLKRCEFIKLKNLREKTRYFKVRIKRNLDFEFKEWKRFESGLRR